MAQDGVKPTPDLPKISTIEVSAEDLQTIAAARPDSQQTNLYIQALEERKRLVQALVSEVVRLKTCLVARVEYAKCGKLSEDGKSVVLGKDDAPSK